MKRRTVNREAERRERNQFQEEENTHHQQQVKMIVIWDKTWSNQQ
jgi:hypothetical protein